MSTVTKAPGAGASLRQARPRYGERAVEALLFLAAAVSIATTIGIVLAIIGPTWDFFREPAVDVIGFFTGTVWTPLFAEAQQRFGVLGPLSATITTSVVALAVAVPLGLGAAVYLSEYASPHTRKVLKPVLEVLAGVPTVVYGFFALTFVTPYLLAPWLPVGTFNMLSAGVVMGMMILPTVASLSEDAMSAVPQSLRDGAYALGSTKMQVSTRVVFPAAVSGIIAAIVLGVSRAVGETMIVAVASGSAPNFSFNPMEAGQTITGFIAQASGGDNPVGTTGYNSLFALAAVLFVLTFAMNLVSIRLVRRFREEYE